MWDKIYSSDELHKIKKHLGGKQKMKEEVIKEIDLREKTLNKILEKIREEERKLCLREEILKLVGIVFVRIKCHKI